MKLLINILIIGLAVTGNLFAQTNSADEKEFKSLVKYVTSEIKKGGRSFDYSKNYISESVVSKVKFRGCEVEIERRDSYYADVSPGLDSKISGSKEAGEVTAARRFDSHTSKFDLKILDASLLGTKPAEDKGLVFLFLKTKNEDREIETRDGKILRFVSKKGFLIRDAESAKVLNSFKTLTRMCQAK